MPGNSLSLMNSLTLAIIQPWATERKIIMYTMYKFIQFSSTLRIKLFHLCFRRTKAAHVMHGTVHERVYTVLRVRKCNPTSTTVYMEVELPLIWPHLEQVKVEG